MSKSGPVDFRLSTFRAVKVSENRGAGLVGWWRVAIVPIAIFDPGFENRCRNLFFGNPLESRLETPKVEFSDPDLV